MRRSPSRALVATLLAFPALAPAARADAGDAKGADAVLEQWARAVGGWKQLETAKGAMLRGKRTETGMETGFEAWVQDGRVKRVLQQPPDRSESLTDGGRSWVKDWNGKALEMQGRDATDQSTASWLETAAYGGLSRAAIRSAHPVSVAADSTGAFDVVHFEPKGGVPFSLYLTRSTGLPAKAVRQPYDDEILVGFADWREVQGIRVPFTLREFTNDDTTGTLTVLDGVELGRTIPAAQFAPLADNAPDYRFTTGNAALGIPFNFENDHIMIECSVNGTKPIWFMLDTGAAYNCINKTRLAEFGLEPFGASTTTGGGNATDFAYTRVESLQVGGVEMLHQRDGVLDMNGLERLYGMPLGGILGYDFVSRFVIRIDYAAKTMDVRELAAGLDVDGGETIPLVLERNHPHVRATVTVPTLDPIAADFIIDSGAAETANLAAPFVRAHQLAELARKTPAGTPNTVPGMEKQFFAQTSVRGKLGSMRLGSLVMQEIPVNLQMGTTGFYSRASFSGTIGSGILKRFTTTYDYSRRTLVLEPNPEFAKPFPPRKTFGATLVSDGPEFKTFKVSGVRKDSPAAAAGLQKGDVIESLDGKPAAALRLADLRQALTDEGGQHVLEITRGSEPKRSVAVAITMVSIEDN